MYFLYASTAIAFIDDIGEVTACNKNMGSGCQIIQKHVKKFKSKVSMERVPLDGAHYEEAQAL